MFRHILGTDFETDELMFHEKDPKFEVSISKSMSEQYIFIKSGSTLTDEVWYIDARDMNTKPCLFHEREYNHKYEIEHHGDKFLILSNLGGKYLNFALFSCPKVNL